MNRNKAYEAAADAYAQWAFAPDAPPPFNERNPAVLILVKQVVDAFLAASGIDPDKTYYVHHKGTTLLTDYWVYDRDNQPNGWMQPVWLGKGDTE